MRERGDLIQLVLQLFRTDDSAERAKTVDQMLAVARSVTKPVAVPPVDVDALAPAERALLTGAFAPISALSDAQLAEFNGLLPWGAMTVDRDGRIVGSAWSASKRSIVQSLVDRRISAFDEVYPLAGRHVLEVGCFEGLHTIGCLSRGARVTAVDSRIENLLKTLARLWAYGMAADVRMWNLEEGPPPPPIPDRWDVLHHMGVLYHLSNPAEHLALALERTEAGLLLDTHIAADAATASERHDALGRTFAYERKGEQPISPFAGMVTHAKWLLLEDIAWICRERGFTDVRVREVRQERNGKRVQLWAFRPGVALPESQAA